MAHKASAILACIKNGVASRTRELEREGIVLQYTGQARLHFRYCIQFWALHCKKVIAESRVKAAERKCHHTTT